MKIVIWHCESMNKWRWVLTDSSRPIIKQESGQSEKLSDVMNDVTNCVEYMLKSTEPNA